MVNYTGHGSEEQWSFSDLFYYTSATTLSNGNRLPMFVLMDCLNGFFQDVCTATSLSKSLMLAPNGGVVAVRALLGFTDAPPQATNSGPSLPQRVAANPKLAQDRKVATPLATSANHQTRLRRTWILFGDPEMQFQFSASSSQPRMHHVGSRER